MKKQIYSQALQPIDPDKNDKRKKSNSKQKQSIHLSQQQYQQSQQKQQQQQQQYQPQNYEEQLQRILEVLEKSNDELERKNNECDQLNGQIIECEEIISSISNEKLELQQEIITLQKQLEQTNGETKNEDNQTEIDALVEEMHKIQDNYENQINQILIENQNLQQANIELSQQQQSQSKMHYELDKIEQTAQELSNENQILISKIQEFSDTEAFLREKIEQQEETLLIQENALNIKEKEWLNSKLISCEKLIEQLMQENNEYQKQEKIIKDQQQQLQSIEQKIDIKLQEKTKEWLIKEEQISIEKNELENNLLISEERIKCLEKENYQSKLLVNELQAIIGELGKQNNSSVQEMLSISQEKDLKINELMETIKNISDEQQQLQQEYDQLKAVLDEPINNEEFKKQIEQLLQENDKLIQNNLSYREQLCKFQQEKKAKEIEQQNLTLRISQLTEKLQSKQNDQTSMHYRVRIAELEKEIELMKFKESKQISVTNSAQILQNKLTNAEIINSKLMTRIKNLEEDIYLLEERNSLQQKLESVTKQNLQSQSNLQNSNNNEWENKYKIAGNSEIMKQFEEVHAFNAQLHN